MFDIRKILLAVAVTALVSTPSFGVDADYVKGSELYKAGKYRDAQPLFSKSLQKDPKNSAAYYCLANCLVMTGQAGAAKSWYQAIITRFPNSPHAGLAREALAKVSTTAGAGSAGGPAKPDAAAAPDIAAAPVIPHPTSSIDPSQLVVVVPPKGDRPAVSKRFIQNVKAALATMPKATCSYLYEQGCRVYVTPTMVDKNPELQNTHPHGYEEGHTYKQAPAIFDGYSVVVAEYTIDPENESLQATDDPLGSVRHEFGHAVDRYLGYLSYKQDFRHFYYLDLGRVSEEDKQKLAYYCQKSDSGPSECFAEVYSGITGGPSASSAWRTDQNKSVMTNFKLVKTYIDKALHSM